MNHHQIVTAGRKIHELRDAQIGASRNGPGYAVYFFNPITGVEVLADDGYESVEAASSAIWTIIAREAILAAETA